MGSYNLKQIRTKHDDFEIVEFKKNTTISSYFGELDKV
jgi:hypothetical protein